MKTCIRALFGRSREAASFPQFEPEDFAAFIFAHLALTAARMFALPAALIFRFFFGAGADGMAVAGALFPFSFAHRA